jgi:hypothetical protein
VEAELRERRAREATARARRGRPRRMHAAGGPFPETAQPADPV